MRNSKILEISLSRLNNLRDLFCSRKFKPTHKSIKREICHRYGLLVRMHLSSDKYSDYEDNLLCHEVNLFVSNLFDKDVVK